jgi:hypothetical protein
MPRDYVRELDDPDKANAFIQEATTLFSPVKSGTTKNWVMSCCSASAELTLRSGLQPAFQLACGR